MNQPTIERVQVGNGGDDGTEKEAGADPVGLTNVQK